MKVNSDNFIRYLKKKNEKALDFVIDTYSGFIKSIVNKHLYNLESLHEECINDVLLAVWYSIDKYDENKGEFKNWLGAITRFKCIGYMRKNLNILEEKNLSDVDASVNNIEVETRKMELREEINMLLESLKPLDKEIFIKYYIEEKNTEEIAQAYNVKKDVIYNRISRGKKKIRALFSNR